MEKMQTTIYLVAYIPTSNGECSRLAEELVEQLDNSGSLQIITVISIKAFLRLHQRQTELRGEWSKRASSPLLFRFFFHRISVSVCEYVLTLIRARVSARFSMMMVMMLMMMQNN